MKLRTIAVFGAGYVLGTLAGRERYAQISAAAGKAAARFGAVPKPGNDGEPPTGRAQKRRRVRG